MKWILLTLALLGLVNNTEPPEPVIDDGNEPHILIGEGTGADIGKLADEFAEN